MNAIKIFIKLMTIIHPFTNQKGLVSLRAVVLVCIYIYISILIISLTLRKSMIYIYISICNKDIEAIFIKITNTIEPIFTGVV